MRSSVRPFYSISHNIRRVQWIFLLAGNLCLIAGVSTLAADEPEAPRNLATASDSGKVETTGPASETRVYEVNGAVITWNVLEEGEEPMSEATRLEIGEALRSFVKQEEPGAFEKATVQTEESGMGQVRLPLHYLLARAWATHEDNDDAREDR